MKYTSIFALTLLAAVPALAQNDLSWVSQRSGNDTFPCGITNPCKTFVGAYAKTNTGGIIKALDAGEYGPINISKSITIDGNGVGASIVATSLGYGVNVSVASGVEIRNLTIHVPASCSACAGITSGNSNVSIDNVSITGSPFYGVVVGGAGSSAGGTATIHGLTVTGAGFGILVQNATATINDSILRYSTYGIQLTATTTVTQALIERSKMISSSNFGLVVQNQGFAATARISDCVISGNNTGVLAQSGGQIITFRNNTWAGNTTDGTTAFSISLK